ncbi:MAG: serine/threonine-protein kinase [Pyrinomonadaceae bacterium]
MGELKLHHCRVDGRYDITECLGHGSYAEIYVANDIAAEPPAPPQVVIKALDLYLQGTPDEELERTLVENFQNEAVALDRVRHPQIINRLGHGTAIDLAGKVFHYLVFEYMPGGDLAALCRQRALPLERTIHYLQQICAGLDHAHSRGVIHRDIKPHNLLLSRDLQIVKIADFGVAKLEASDEVITRVGTDVYAAPEHHPMLHTGPLEMAGLASRKKGLTPAADVYSLAKTTYTMLTGESPRRFAQKPITGLPPASEHHFWSAPVLKVLRKATDPQVEGRYQSAQQFLTEMREAALAPTRLLDETTTAQALATNAQATAPPAPVFSPSEVANQHAAAEPHPRIVVSLDGSRREASESPQLRPSAHHQQLQAPVPRRRRPRFLSQSRVAELFL